MTLVLQLVDEGSVSLEDTVDRWIDDVPNGDRIMVRELAAMESGLADYTNAAFVEDFVADPERVFTDEEMIAYATAEPARADPGADRVYRSPRARSTTRTGLASVRSTDGGVTPARGSVSPRWSCTMREFVPPWAS